MIAQSHPLTTVLKPLQKFYDHHLIISITFVSSIYQQLTNTNTYHTIEVSANNSTVHFYVFSPRPRRIV